MTDLLIIKNEGKGSVIYSLLSIIFESKQYNCTGTELNVILQENKPDFTLVDFNGPVSGNDLMSMVSKLDKFFRLRVFYISFRFRSLPSLKYSFKNLLSPRIN